MSSRRPRRSRIYDLNYNLGESYYRSAVDRLDENSRSKPSLSRFSEPPPQTSPTKNRFESSAAELEDELELSRERASKAIQRETVFDRPVRKLELEVDFDEQVKKSLERIQASKKLLKSIDHEEAYQSNERSSSVAAASSRLNVQKRTVKMSSDVESSAVQSRKELAKWSNDTDYHDSQSFAKLRARKSAQQLAEIEQDMAQISQIQKQRDQRMSSVRKLLAESSLDDLPPVAPISNGLASLKITKTTSKKVTTY